MTEVRDQKSDVGNQKAGRRALTKKIILLTLCSLLLASSSAAVAQQPKKIPRIGYLSNNAPATESTRSEAIRLALHELGYIEGQNIAIDYRYTGGETRSAA